MNKQILGIFVVFCLTFCCLEATDLKIYVCRPQNNQRYLAKINKLQITGCNKYPCELRRNTNASIEVEFESKARITDVELKIEGELNGKRVPFNAQADNHCVTAIDEMKSQSKCLLKRNEKYRYKFGMDIKEEYPTVSVTVHYSLMFKGKPILCFNFPARIVN